MQYSHRIALQAAATSNLQPPPVLLPPLSSQLPPINEQAHAKVAQSVPTAEQKRAQCQAILDAKLTAYKQLISDPNCDMCGPKATAMWKEYQQLHHAFDKDYPSSASNKQPSLQPAKTGIDSTHTAHLRAGRHLC